MRLGIIKALFLKLPYSQKLPSLHTMQYKERTCSNI